MQIHFLSTLVNQLALKTQHLLLKTGILFIIVVCSTSEVVVSRIAEKEAEPQNSNQPSAASSQQADSPSADNRNSKIELDYPLVIPSTTIANHSTSSGRVAVSRQPSAVSKVGKRQTRGRRMLQNPLKTRSR